MNNDKKAIPSSHISSNKIFISNGQKDKKNKKSDMNDMKLKKDKESPQKDTSTGNTIIKKSTSNSDVKNKGKSNVSTATSDSERKDLLCVMNDMNDMNDVQLDLFISNITHITSFGTAFGCGALESVFKHFLKNGNIATTYEELSKAVETTTESVRNPVNRHREYFAEGEKKLMKKTICLSDLGMRHCFKILKRYTDTQNGIKENISKEQKEKSKLDGLSDTASLLFTAINPEIINKKAVVDFSEIAAWNPDFADLILDTPDDVLDLIKDQLQFAKVDDLRIKNIPESDSIAIERIRAKHIDKLLSIHGRCVSLSSVRPTTINIRYECPSCGTIISIRQTEKKKKEPSRCSCGRRGGFKVLSKDVEDQARIILEDLQERTDNANTQRIDCILKDNLTLPEEIAIFSPGEELNVIGIVREVKKITANGEENQMGLMVEIIHAEKIEEEVDVDTFTEEELNEFKELSDKINKKGLISVNKSFAPDVHGYEQHKNAIIMQCSTKRNDPSASSTRNKISMLMIGDPGIAKTVLGKFAVSITPHSKMAAGGGSSAVGITASVVKEDESLGGYRVEPGAMVLAKELLFLDEMNNITEDDKPKLQQGMSEQQISINKANLHVNLKVQSGILATANPINGHFIEGMNIFKQFNISSPIVNRFDAIFVMRDKADVKRDNAIAEIMIKRRRNEINPEYNKEFLRKFFVYIRAQPEPTISDSIIKKIQKIYSSSRQGTMTDVIINPRFIESLTRFMEASAKLRLSVRVEEKDIERSLEILSASHFSTRDWSHFQDNDEPVTKKLIEAKL